MAGAHLSESWVNAFVVLCPVCPSLLVGVDGGFVGVAWGACGLTVGEVVGGPPSGYFCDVVCFCCCVYAAWVLELALVVGAFEYLGAPLSVLGGGCSGGGVLVVGVGFPHGFGYWCSLSHCQRASCVSGLRLRMVMTAACMAGVIVFLSP